jgi:hypothetical protein
VHDTVHASSGNLLTVHNAGGRAVFRSGTVCDPAQGDGFQPAQLADADGSFVEQQEMEMEREINSLSDGELDAFVGGKIKYRTKPTHLKKP